VTVPIAVQTAYDESIPSVRELAKLVGDSVSHWASSNDYLFKGRIKDADSLAEKLETGRYPAWRDIDDLYACTVVIPTTLHIERALEYLKTTFLEREIKGQGISQKAPDVFRFDAPRFIGTLVPQPEGERPEGLDAILFEVQVLTAFEYAWVVATHDLVYKAGHVDWRRARLAAHLKAAAEEADALITSFELTAEAIPVSPHPWTNQKERVAAFFKQAHTDGRIPDTVVPTSWSRFSENVVDLVRSFAARDRMDEQLDLLLQDAEELLASGDIPVSGSLFQTVTGLRSRRDGPAALKKYIIVDSSELRDLHGVTEVPRPFEFA
jgi:ppGpp synthetase/RelA/SpoT-type nucleotidyltranferase